MPTHSQERIGLKRTRVPYRIMEVKPRKDIERVVTRKTPPFFHPPPRLPRQWALVHPQFCDENTPSKPLLGLVFDLQHLVLSLGVHERHLVVTVPDCQGKGIYSIKKSHNLASGPCKKSPKKRALGLTKSKKRVITTV